MKFTGVFGLDALSLLYRTENRSSLIAENTTVAKPLVYEFLISFCPLGVRHLKLSLMYICCSKFFLKTMASTLFIMVVLYYRTRPKPSIFRCFDETSRLRVTMTEGGFFVIGKLGKNHYQCWNLKVCS